MLIDLDRSRRMVLDAWTSRESQWRRSPDAETDAVWRQSRPSGCRESRRSGDSDARPDRIRSLGDHPCPSLTQSERETYADKGVLHPVRVLSDDQALTLRRAVEGLERPIIPRARAVTTLKQFFRVNGQTRDPAAGRDRPAPAILDAVESILGPDLLVWSVELFIKEPGDGTIVSWHQDITYWGMGETDEEVTAWLALSDVSVAKRAACGSSPAATRAGSSTTTIRSRRPTCSAAGRKLQGSTKPSQNPGP
jgi:hypothetical protein